MFSHSQRVATRSLAGLLGHGPGRPSIRGFSFLPNQTHTSTRIKSTLPWNARPHLRLLSSSPSVRDLNKQPEAKTFAGPSKPGPVHSRPQPKQRELPSPYTDWQSYFLFAVFGLASWGGFLIHATNQERLASSVVKQASSNLRNSPKVKSALGNGIHLEPKWWLGGHPWIDGSINLLQGHVDLSFRIEGSLGAGTVYFTSVRKAKGADFTILRFKVICDNGTTILLNDSL